MSVAMIVGFSLSFAVYFGAMLFHWGGKPIRMSGWTVYDFFMGGERDSPSICRARRVLTLIALLLTSASLNPQIWNVDLKVRFALLALRLPSPTLTLLAALCRCGKKSASPGSSSSTLPFRRGSSSTRPSATSLLSVRVIFVTSELCLTSSRSQNMAFMVLATGLYINACAKGEECIPQTIDMFYEKDGFMLTFWNFAGV
jgi:hypothetical protein